MDLFLAYLLPQSHSLCKDVWRRVILKLSVLVFYCCIMNYHTLSISKHHMLVIEEFLLVMSLGIVYLDSQILTRLKSRCWLGHILIWIMESSSRLIQIVEIIQFLVVVLRSSIAWFDHLLLLGIACCCLIPDSLQNMVVCSFQASRWIFSTLFISLTACKSSLDKVTPPGINFLLKWSQLIRALNYICKILSAVLCNIITVVIIPSYSQVLNYTEYINRGQESWEQFRILSSTLSSIHENFISSYEMMPWLFLSELFFFPKAFILN